jgi:LuxR family maltose regulon positive regulatory protein
VGQISEQLYLSTNTVKTHAQSVYRKLGVHSRSQAVAAARRHGLV